MGAKETAEKIILRRKLDAEKLADANLNIALKDDKLKMLFVKCKELVVSIAKIEVAGKRADKEREEYNKNRELLGEVLVSLGLSKSDLKPNYFCKKCNDTGYVNNKQCECLKKEISKELISLSGIDTKTFAKFSSDFSIFSNPEEIKFIYDKMKKFVDNIDTTPVDTILIFGNTGVGKTHLLQCMTTKAIESGRFVKYTTAFGFNQEMLKYHCAKLEDKDEIMSAYINSEILFVDDLGSENKINNVTNEYLYLVINERMQNHKKTVITTNLDFKQIQDSYGERVFSRLMHKKQSLKINFDGDDLRIKK